MRFRRLQSWFRSRHQHPNFWQTKPRPKPQHPRHAQTPRVRRRKPGRSHRCLLYARNPYLVCAVHPTGSDTDTCPDFQENPNAEPDELWEPEGASYYNGELILQRPAAVDTRATVRTFGYSPLVYWPMSPV